MAQALYRKWRPARFNEIVGQEHVTQTLQNAVAAGRLAQAYLFSGPRGTGKTTTARLVAKAANCLAEDLTQRPCNACAPCRSVNEGRYLDLIEIDAASNTGVDDIRDLREKINFSPNEGRFKTYIIDEVHMLSTAAFNALLKTLEEPPPHAIFVLATTEEHKVPLTIKSRCQQFNFRLLTTQEIIGRIGWLADEEQIIVEPQAITMIAHHAAGSLRDAESLLDQLIGSPNDTITLERAQMVLGTASDAAVSDLTDAWLSGDGAAGLTVIHQALDSGADARQFSRQMVSYLRQLLLLKTAGDDIALNVTEEVRRAMVDQAKRARRKDYIEAVKQFNEAAVTPSRSWQPQLPLELAFIELLSFTGEANVAEPLPSNVDVKLSPKSEETICSEGRPPLVLSVKDEPDVDYDQNVIPRQTLSETEAGEQQTITLKQVTGHWPQLRDSVGRMDKSLPALLASCKPLAMEGNKLILGFDYPILKDKFDNKPQAKEIVARALGDLLGTTYQVQSVVTEQYSVSSATTEIDKADFVALAEELGGVIRKK
jgi:DNA polymerase-3 subunit gamma/tau